MDIWVRRLQLRETLQVRECLIFVAEQKKAFRAINIGIREVLIKSYCDVKVGERVFNLLLAGLRALRLKNKSLHSS